MKPVKNIHDHKVPRTSLFSRDQYLLEIAAGREILHVGCVDHPALIEKKMSEGKYLHALLQEVASNCDGYDINSDGIRQLREMGFVGVYDDKANLKEKYDLVIVPDVIEHVQDCGAFLHQLKSIECDQFIFTTPNAFRLENRLRLTSEVVNDDHRYWFSPFTITKLLEEAGYSVKRLDLCDVARRRYPIRTLLKRQFPLTRGTIVVSATIT